MNNYKNIDWYKDGPERALDIFYEEENSEKALQFLEYLLQHYPKLDIDWIYSLVDIKENLLAQQNFTGIEHFVDQYQKAFPGSYANKYEFIERDLITHYLYHGKIQKVKERLEIIKQNPVRGIDTVTIRALFQLIYHGHYQLALGYSKVVWEPVYKSTELVFSGHMDFSLTIYLHELEQVYLSVKEGKKPDMKGFIKKMEDVDIGDEESVYKRIFSCLEEDPDITCIKTGLDSDRGSALLKLNIYFLKYMKEKFGLPFILSDRFFNMMMSPKLYGNKGTVDCCLYIPYPILEDHFYNRYDNMYLTNDIEIFGKVFGLEYVYLFFHDIGMISDEYYEAMRENIQVLKNEFMKTTFDELWQMAYVFNWPQSAIPDPSPENMFRDTYNKSYGESKAILKNYFNDFIVPDRVQSEYKRAKKTEVNPKDTLGEIFYSGIDPYIIEETDIGRNEPCPCGSGKKYKKCCGSSFLSS
ncbi:MAG: SEC-C metal-binding domain-containing protein [Bacteroidota bacterium]|nr:SEC-C metal-binding domain-containing protein [Bacteroidota bacterium]